MNEKMTFHSVAAAIANATGCTVEEGARFLRTLLDRATEALAHGERVTIKGIGTFAPGDPSQNGTVIWAPDQALALAVNEPFAAFDPVVLAPGVTEQQLSAAAQPMAETPTDKPAREESPTIAPEPTPAQPEPVEPIPVQPEPIEPPEPVAIQQPCEPTPLDNRQPDVADNSEQPADTAYTPAADEPEYTEPTIDDHYRQGGLNPWLMMLVGLIVGLVVGYFVGISMGYLSGASTTDGDFDDEDEELVDSLDTADGTTTDDDADAIIIDDAEPEATPQPQQAPKETAPAVATQPAAAPSNPAVVTDTVSGRRYLTTMARKYYGNNCFWVYIYEENSDIISNPDLIRPGTVVVIPPASKYGIDANDPASVRRATAKIAEIQRNKKRK